MPLTRAQQIENLRRQQRGEEPLLPPPPQPRWLHQVDLNTAFTEAGDILEVFSKCLRWPDAQPFSGGVWDAWPTRLAEGLAFCREEWAAVLAYLRHEAEAKHG